MFFGPGYVRADEGACTLDVIEVSDIILLESCCNLSDYLEQQQCLGG